MRNIALGSCAVLLVMVMARTDWTESGWTNPVKMRCPRCKTVWQVSGKDAERGGVGCKKPECRGEALHRA